MDTPLIPNNNPQLDMGGVGDAGSKNNQPVVDVETSLGKHQQEFLGKQRTRLCGLVAASDPNQAEIAETYRVIAGRIHVANWAELEPFFVALGNLSPEYHSAFILFGGWYHNGNLQNLQKPNVELTRLIEKYRLLRHAEYWRCKVVAEKEKAWSDNVNGLVVCLAKCQTMVPMKLWREPRELELQIEAAKRRLEPQIESALLFMQPRLFVFSPEKGRPLAGWKDFTGFVNSYYEIEKYIQNFDPFYWGIYPSRIEPKTPG